MSVLYSCSRTLLDFAITVTPWFLSPSFPPWNPTTFPHKWGRWEISLPTSQSTSFLCLLLHNMLCKASQGILLEPSVFLWEVRKGMSPAAFFASWFRHLILSDAEADLISLRKKWMKKLCWCSSKNDRELINLRPLYYPVDHMHGSSSNNIACGHETRTLTVYFGVQIGFCMFSLW